MNLAELKNLDFEDIGNWPPIVKIIATALLVAAVLVAGYMLDTKEMRSRLEKVEHDELALIKEFRKRQKVVANFESYRTQLTEMEENLDTLLRQLPTKTEMPDLLENISNTGIVNGLIFDRFKPESEVPHEFYAKQPISIRARGTYHQFGAFLSGVSALPRIVTVGSLKIGPGNESKKRRGQKEMLTDEQLVLEAKLTTFRYIDENEVQVQ